MSKLSKKERITRAHFRGRKKVKGSTEKPRLSVYKTNSHVYAQIIDDTNKVTLASASSVDKELKSSGMSHGGNCAAAEKVGKLIARRALSKKILEVVFDRGGFAYHDRIAALAESAREAGLKF